MDAEKDPWNLQRPSLGQTVGWKQIIPQFERQAMTFWIVTNWCLVEEDIGAKSFFRHLLIRFWWCELLVLRSLDVIRVFFALFSQMNWDAFLLLRRRWSSQLLGNNFHGGETCFGCFHGAVWLYESQQETVEPELVRHLSFQVNCFLVLLPSNNKNVFHPAKCFFDWLGPNAVCHHLPGDWQLALFAAIFCAPYCLNNNEMYITHAQIYVSEP